MIGALTSPMVGAYTSQVPCVIGGYSTECEIDTGNSSGNMAVTQTEYAEINGTPSNPIAVEGLLSTTPYMAPTKTAILEVDGNTAKVQVSELPPNSPVTLPNIGPSILAEVASTVLLNFPLRTTELDPTIAVLGAPLAAPTGVEAVAETPTTVNLRWNTEAVDTYQVWHIVDGQPLAMIGQQQGGIGGAIITGLLPDAKETLAVRAVLGSQYSAFSSPIVVQTAK